VTWDDMAASHDLSVTADCLHLHASDALDHKNGGNISDREREK